MVNMILRRRRTLSMEDDSPLKRPRQQHFLVSPNNVLFCRRSMLLWLLLLLLSIVGPTTSFTAVVLPPIHTTFPPFPYPWKSISLTHGIIASQSRRLAFPLGRHNSVWRLGVASSSAIDSSSLSSSTSSSSSSSNLQSSNGRGDATATTTTTADSTQSKKPFKKFIRQRHHNTQEVESKRNTIRRQFQKAKALERQGQWRKAVQILYDILDMEPTDAYSHLALAKLQARRNNYTAAHECFVQGTMHCPESVHLWQAWAVHEEALGNLDQARTLYEKALQLDGQNPYVCHAFGLMEYRLRNIESAQLLWEHGLRQSSTAALVCSLGRLLIERQEFDQARQLYRHHVDKLESARQKTEVYLAMAWLEENYFANFEGAEDLIQQALVLEPKSGLAQVALARLQGRSQQRLRGENVHAATSRQLANAINDLEQGKTSNQPNDGRLYNAWANMEVKSRRYSSARKILRRGMERYPNDHTLLQAAGKVEERVGNYSGARDLYGQSLSIQPSAPTLVAYAMLELRQPKLDAKNFSTAERLFEEALLLDPRHGPAYNSYGNANIRQGMYDKARDIFERGVKANCTDAASVYHGYAQLELSLGNVKRAKLLLRKGMSVARSQEIGTDSPHRDRASFLAHTLGMLELNSEQPIMALEVFTEAIKRYGNSSQLLLGAALCEAKLGHEEKARCLFKRSVSIDEQHAQAWQAWGVMEMRSGNWDIARDLLQRGIRNDRKHGALWLAYATLEGRMGNVETSRTLFAHGIKHARNHAPLYQAWASLELRLGNFTDAKTLISEALSRDKRNGSGWIVAADIERQLGNLGLVNLILRRGIECCPTHVELYQALGDSLLSGGRINEARQVFEKGIEIDPLYAPIYHSLAELEARVFNLEGLAKLNKKAESIFKKDAGSLSHTIGEETWSQRIKARRLRTVPRDVDALSQRIVEDDENSLVTDERQLVDLVNMKLLEGGDIDTSIYF